MGKKDITKLSIEELVLAVIEVSMNKLNARITLQNRELILLLKNSLTGSLMMGDIESTFSLLEKDVEEQDAT